MLFSLKGNSNMIIQEEIDDAMIREVRLIVPFDIFILLLSYKSDNGQVT